MQTSVPPAHSPQAPHRGQPPLLTPQARTRRLLLVGALCAVAAGTSSLVLFNFKDASVYAKGVDQVLADKAHWVGRNVRIEGTMVRGSMQFRNDPCEYRFEVTRNGKTVLLVYPTCIKPPTLRDDMPDVGVTAEGRLMAGGEFVATNVLAKCPSKYETKDNPGGPLRPGGPREGIDPTQAALPTPAALPALGGAR